MAGCSWLCVRVRVLILIGSSKLYMPVFSSRLLKTPRCFKLTPTYPPMHSEQKIVQWVRQLYCPFSSLYKAYSSDTDTVYLHRAEHCYLPIVAPWCCCSRTIFPVKLERRVVSVVVSIFLSVCTFFYGELHNSQSQGKVSREKLNESSPTRVS